MTKKLLVVLAHPDDEAFGPGGTLAKYAAEGVDIHLLCATKGEAGEWEKKEDQNSKYQDQRKKKVKIEHLREQELLESAKVLGIKKVEFLDFIDGHLSNSHYHRLADKIINKINSFRPQVIVTFDQNGISGHLDHIAVSFVATYAFRKTEVANKLYYLCMLDQLREKSLDEYFIYFPEGRSRKEITTKIDYTSVWDIKVTAMNKHKTQLMDVNRILKRISRFPKIDYYILKYHRNIRLRLPEIDLFTGIGD